MAHVCRYGDHYWRLVTAATPGCELNVYGVDHCDDCVRAWAWFQHVALHGYRAERPAESYRSGDIWTDVLPLDRCHNRGSGNGFAFDIGLCPWFSQCPFSYNQSGCAREGTQCL